MALKQIVFALAFLALPQLSTGLERIQLSGYLGEDQMQSFSKTIQNVKSGETLYLDISSTTGDLKSVMDFARKLYSIKAEKGLKVIAYIDQNALGPSALLPFIAEERFASLYASWGDIPLGSSGVIPANILRKQVVGLIPDGTNADALRLVAQAMSDPSFELVDDQGIRQANGKGSPITRKDETLVLNQNEMAKYGLVSGLLSRRQFEDRFGLFQKELIPAAAASQMSLEQKLKEHIQVHADGRNVVGHIKIDDRTSGISQSTWIYVSKALEYYKELKPDFIILELNTPGGEVFAAQKISDALKDFDTQQGIPVITFINNWAISAGAMLAYSTRFITVVKDGSMGAAEPVLQGEGGEMKTASEKVNSALRADFANRARFSDRNPDIAEAMVDKDIILVERNGKITRLSAMDEIVKSGPNPDKVITVQGKLLTLNAEQLIEYGVADVLLLPKRMPAITEEEENAGKWPASKMLLFHSPFFESIPNAEVYTYQMDWKTRFFALITTPVVSSILFLGMMLGFYIEFNTPGFGVPGTIGVTCLVLIIIASFALEIGSALELILLVVSIGMLAVEIFVLPSFGLLGFAGIAFFLAGVIGLLLPSLGTIDYEFDSGTFNASGEALMNRLAWISGTIFVGIVLMGFLARYLMPTFAAFSPLVLSGNEQDAGKGFYAGAMPDEVPKVGQIGVALSTLRPAGKVLINDVIYDATTAGGFIEKDTRIIVSRIEGNLIVVDEKETAV